MPTKTDELEARIASLEALVERLTIACGHLAVHGDARSHRPSALLAVVRDYEEFANTTRLRGHVARLDQERQRLEARS